VTRLLGDVIARGTRSAIHAYGRGAVVKVPKAATPDNWMAEDWIQFEAQYAEAARAAGAPAARLLGIESIAGRPASVWERIEGVTMWQQLLDRPDRSVQSGRRLADLQLALFELVAPVALPSQRDRLVSKIRLAAAKVDAGLAQALDLIPERVGRPRLCHGDLHPSNVILGRDGPVIVDWYDASRGDQVADVARTCLMLLGDGGVGPRHLPGANGSMLDSLTRAYLERLWEPLELDADRLRRWQGINAAARMAEGLASSALFEVWERSAELNERSELVEDPRARDDDEIVVLGTGQLEIRAGL
jgi:aminoglycoside phosphotransferase (APT) family kinase protein